MSRRTDRINGLLQEEISRILQKDLRDPRLSRVVTIARVEVSSDLQQARVYVSALGGEAEERDALAGLRSASSFLRRELGQRLQLRRTPALQFVPDVATREGDQVLSLLDDISTKETSQNDDA